MATLSGSAFGGCGSGAYAFDLQPQTVTRAAISAACRRPEAELVPMLLDRARMSPALATATLSLARRLAATLRQRQGEVGGGSLVQALLQEFALSSREGVALMCLAEALLRIPDAATRDALIRDKIAHGDWRAHLGHSHSLFVNAATWGLLLGGRLIGAHGEGAGLGASLGEVVGRIVSRGGEPLIRKGVDVAMRLLGEHFVAGRDIAEALARGARREAEGFRHSYDMLGEAALTADDAARYAAAYADAIDAIGRAAGTADGQAIHERPGISVKLSALHPRYCRAQRARVHAELYPRLCALALQARACNIGLNIDAEEADRLELSLDLLERLCAEPALAGWDGIGFVVQAYQKRCLFVIDHLLALARRSAHRLMIRLVKGAYWDSEIKRAQLDGVEGYPVYTRKAYTDLSYLAAARRLLAAPAEAFPQFATHNAHTLAAIHHLVGADFTPGQYEFQCLHGMGEALYEQVVRAADAGGLGRPCRIYAPVGSHDTLLAYLVRRLLENGANSSFVNRIADSSVPLDEVVADPVAEVERLGRADAGSGAGQGADGTLGRPHPRIPLPRALYGTARLNARGIDLACEQRLTALALALAGHRHDRWCAAPMLGEEREDYDEGEGSTAAAPAAAPWQPVRNPADADDIVGKVRAATADDVDDALRCAVEGAAHWREEAPAARAAVLERAARAIEDDMPRFIGLLIREAGKTLPAALAEVREAIDALRYYAVQVRHEFANDSHRPLGVVACISPWNFPLAIFTGQIAAALAAGNAVLAKPAQATPLVAAQAVRMLHAAGVPRAALQLLPGPGAGVGARLAADARVGGVMFTGSIEVARALQRTLAARACADGRCAPLIAETGGLNAMIVDSSALYEQVVSDVLASAFDSAGQRCSALRVLCVQEEAAARVLAMLRGAMAELCVGDPSALHTDVGPVIDAAARAAIERHIDAMRARGHPVWRTPERGGRGGAGHYVMPTLIELERFDDIRCEVFGPVLHVLRYRRGELDALVERINASGYGLTLGVQSRIDATVARVVGCARVGNVYVNRNMIGAVIGVQPFGGEGLSGTGPKTGGPLYLYRLLAAWPEDGPARALARCGEAEGSPAADRSPALAALQEWARAAGGEALVALCAHYAARAAVLTAHGRERRLAGPTGQRDTYRLCARPRILCLAADSGDLLAQLAAVLAVGATALWPDDGPAPSLRERLPAAVQAHIVGVGDARNALADCDAVLHHGDAAERRALATRLAAQDGAIVPLLALDHGDTAIALEQLFVERALSINTAAAGGNAALMSLAGA